MEVINEKKVSIIRKYPIETLVVLCLTAIVFLTGWLYKTSEKVDSVQKRLETYLYDDRKILIEALNNSTEVIVDVKEFLKNKK